MQANRDDESTGSVVGRSRRLRRMLCLTFAAAAVLAAAFWLAFRTPRTGLIAKSEVAWGSSSSSENARDRWLRQPGYAGSEACRYCHPNQFATYLATAHSRALVEVDSEQEPPGGTFDHFASGGRYRVAVRSGRLFHDESMLLDDGSEMALASFPVRYRVGSGHFGRTYLCEADGYLMESPITWYEPRHAWDMSPGYDSPDHQSFSRSVPENCLLCHAGQIETSRDTDFRLRLVENSIGCERCHGPGENHVALHTSDRSAEPAEVPRIVNPQRLSRAESEAICQQCHLKGDFHVAARGKRVRDYRPGLRLEEFRTEFRVQRATTGIPIVGHFEQMGQSACYRVSGTLTCTTCHDPHDPVAPGKRAEHYRSVCLTCHGERECQLPLSKRNERTENDCVACHMPRAGTEVPHVAFTHHQIGIHPLTSRPDDTGGNDLVCLSDLSLLPERERQRTLALARFERYRRESPDFRDSPEGRKVGWQIDEMFRQLPDSMVDGAVETARAELRLDQDDLRGAGQAAERALEFEEIETDIEVRALAVLGSIAFRQNQAEEARRWFARLVRIRRSAVDWYYLGLSENNCGNAEAAIAALQRSRELDPSSTGTCEALVMLHHVRNEKQAERQLNDEIARLARRVPPGGAVRKVGK